MRQSVDSHYIYYLINKYDGFFAGLFFSITLIIFFFEAMLPGKVLSPSGDLLNTPLFLDQNIQHVNEPFNNLLFDQIFQFYPWRYFAWSNLRQGILPLWNPNSYCGTTFIGTMQSAVFYPINLFLTLVPFEQTFIYSAIIRLWIAGMYMYLLCRKYALHIISSLISSISFMLCGFLIVWLGHPHTNVAIWLPALIYYLEGCISYNSKKEYIRNMVFLSLIVGIQFLGGHIETSLDMLVTAGVYSVIRCIQIYSIRHLEKIIFTLITMAFPPIVFGIGIACIQLLPFIEWLPLSAEYSLRSASTFHYLNSSQLIDIVTIPLFFFPNIFLNPSWDLQGISYLLPWSNYNEDILYIGFLPFIFALQACFDYKSDKHPFKLAWIILLVISFGRSFHLPILDWINFLPILKLGQPERLRLVIAFALAILAGFGFEGLWSEGEKGRNSLSEARNRSIFFTITGILMLFAFAASVPYLRNSYISINNLLVTPDKSVIADINFKFNELLRAYSISNIRMYLPVFWSGGLWVLVFLHKTHKISNAIIQASILFIVVADLISFGNKYNPVLTNKNFYPQNSLSMKIQQDHGLFRTTALNSDYFPDLQIFYGISDIRGLDFPTKWIDEYMNLTGNRINWIPYGMILSRADSPLLTMLNLKYIISSDSSLLSDKYEKLQIGNLWLGIVKKFMPRAWFAEEVVVTSESEIKERLKNISDEQVGKIVFLNEREADIQSMWYGSSDGQIQNTYDAPLQNTWAITAKQDGLFFISDSFYPGWKAYIDGNETKILRANIAFRAIKISAGKHKVEFRYEPLSFKIGTIISAISLIFLLGAFFLRINHMKYH